MRRKEKNISQVNANSLDNLMAGFTEALEENSEQIIEALAQLKGKKLSFTDKKELKKIGRSLKGLDQDLDSLGIDIDELGGF